MASTTLANERAQAGIDAAGGGIPLQGVAIGQVINNLDSTNLGRVQVSLPWLPGIEPWARVSAASAGSGRGSYFIPQIGDEVLLAFQHGDIRDAFVLGTLWSAADKPPSKTPLDPVNRRLIRTPVGHEIEMHDLEQAVTVTTSTGQKIRLEPTKIELTAGGSKVTLETSGSVSITAAAKIELKAPSITLDAAQLELKASATAKMTAGAVCEIQGGLVKIN